MQKTRFAKITLFGFLVLFGLVFAKFVPVAEPASASSTATISVLEEISIQQDAALNFGQVLAPTSGSQIFTVNLDGSPGPGSGDFLGGQNAGTVSFFGNDNASFTISIALGACQGFSTGTETSLVAHLTSVLMKISQNQTAEAINKLIAFNALVADKQAAGLIGDAIAESLIFAAGDIITALQTV